MKRIFISGFLLFVVFSLSAQLKEMVLEGKYYGESLYIYNPSVNDAFCVQYIVVNEDTLTEELNTNAIEVDFSLLAIEPEQEVYLNIVYDSICKPLVVNPNALFPPNPFKFSKPRVREGSLQWFVYGDISDHQIEVQHKKWDEWIVVGEVDPLDTIRNRYYSSDVKLHSGNNEFRLHTVNLKGDEVYSKEIQFKPPYVAAVTLVSLKVEDEIEFSHETEYELYTLDGTLLKKGLDRYVEIGDLDKGSYYLRYDNRATEIKKKK